MTRRSSTRALAREIYREMVAQETPTPNPSPQGGREQAVPGGGETTDFTARVRALYEGSDVPVREIAALAGVTERTLYKYVEKHNWRRRYRLASRDEAVARANRGRRWRPAPGFAPAKGAGGRFIRRADKDKPFAVGLKATDAAGAARARKACGRAQAVARKAQAVAQRHRRAEERLRAMNATNQALERFAHYRAERAKRAPSHGAPVDKVIAQALRRAIDVALDWWQQLQTEETVACDRMRQVAPSTVGNR